MSSKRFSNGNYSAIHCFPANPLRSGRMRLNEWLASHRVFRIFTEVVTALFSCSMANVTRNSCRFGTRSVYTIQPCTSLLCHFIRPRIRRTLVCLTVTYHLNMCQTDLDILCCIVYVAGRRNGYRNESQLKKLTLKKTILPLPGLEPATFPSRIRRSATELSPFIVISN